MGPCLVLVQWVVLGVDGNPEGVLQRRHAVTDVFHLHDIHLLTIRVLPQIRGVTVRSQHTHYRPSEWPQRRTGPRRRTVRSP